jgi:hypothetical protein
MTVDQQPFADVTLTEDGFSLPELKWRELLFTGALRPDGGAYVRDPSRPLPPFQIEGLFPDGQRFAARRAGGRVGRLRILGPGGRRGGRRATGGFRGGRERPSRQA